MYLDAFAIPLRLAITGQESDVNLVGFSPGLLSFCLIVKDA